MRADDPRHGTYAGANQHWMDDEKCCPPCRTAATEYRYNRRKRLYLTRGPLEVPAVGTLRRIRALCALGYFMREIDVGMGRRYGYTSQIRNHAAVYRSTHRTIARIYDQWSMQPPPQGPLRDRQRRMCHNWGWAPPLAWDDIDDPDETPAGAYRPVKNRRDGELAAEWEHLRGLGVSIEQAADQLGVTVGAIEKACARAKEAA